MKMNPKSLFLSIIILISLSFPLQAAVITQVYEVTLPVVNQQRDVRNAAFEQGLVEVSIRVSGSSMAPAQLDIKKATQMVSQYRYQQMSESEISAYRKLHSGPEPRYKLWIQYDENRVKRMLKDSGLPIWGLQRPNVMVWLAVMDGKNRYLLKQSSRSPIKDALAEEAGRRGLPVVWPRLDAADRQKVGFSDVWGQFIEPIRAASKSYPVNAILLGRMNWTGGRWQVDWSLHLEDRIESWKLSAVELDRLMGSGVGVATDHIASRFAVVANQMNAESLQLRVNDLNNLDEYARVTRYLASLEPVKNVYATAVHADYVDFHLKLNGGEDDLRRIIALGRVLTPDARPLILPVPVVAGSAGQNGQQADGQRPSAEAASSVANPQTAGETVVAPAYVPQQPVLQYRVNG